MNARKVCQRLVGMLMVVLLVAGCGAPDTPPSVASPVTPTSSPPTPTSTAIPTATATTPPAADTPQDVVADIDTFLITTVDEGSFSGAALITRNGQIVLSKGYGLADREQKIPNTPQTQFRLGSTTKPFTALAILMLQEQGKLDVQDRICLHLPRCLEERWQEITIHHLLTHTSGVPMLHSQPGEEFEYSNIGYELLGQIVEHASGQSYAAFVQDSIFGPLDMTATSFGCTDGDLAVGYQGETAVPYEAVTPYAYPSTGLCSTVEDLYRLEQALSTEQLIPQPLLDDMFTAHVTMEPPPAPFYRGWSYGYGWAIGEEDGHRVIEHPGLERGFVSVIARYPDDNVAIILLSNQENLDVVTDIKPEVAQKVFSEQ